MDWFVVLAPLLALILILIFGFTGCSVETGGLRERPIIEVNTRFFPTDDLTAPTQLASAHLTPVDSDHLDSGDFPPMPDPVMIGFDGSRQQRFVFHYEADLVANVRSSVSGTSIGSTDGDDFDPNHFIDVPPIPDGQKAVVLFTATRGATGWDRPIVGFVDDI